MASSKTTPSILAATATAASPSAHSAGGAIGGAPSGVAAGRQVAAQGGHQLSLETGFYHPELDGLRFLAFLAVFLHHALLVKPIITQNPLARTLWEWWYAINYSGTAGVDLFFVLSSYLITELLRREYAVAGRLDIPAFYARRALRIWPLYYAYFLFALLLERGLSRWFPGNLPALDGLTGDHAWSFGLFLGNWTSGVTGFPRSTAAHLWTVSIEEQFYIVWPLLVAVVTPRHLGKLIAGLFLVAYGTRLAMWWGEAEHLRMYCNTLARLDSIAWGAWISWMFGGQGASFKPWSRRIMILAAMAAVTASIRYGNWTLEGPLTLAESFYYGVAAFASAMVLLAVLQPAGLAAGWLTWRPFVYLGRISYGLYVYHRLGLYLTPWLVKLIGPYLIPLFLMVWKLPFQQTLVSLGFPLLVAFTTTLLFSVISYHAFERPFLRLKQRFARVVSRPEG